MRVIKRNGVPESLDVSKITKRLKLLSKTLNVQVLDVSQRVANGMVNNIKTSEIDILTAETASYMTSIHPDYGILAARIAVNNLHKTTRDSFSSCMNDLFQVQKVSSEFYASVMRNEMEFNEMVNDEKDYEYDYFAFKTLERSYLLRINNIVHERPQYMLLRVAIQLHGDNVDLVKESYDLMSQGYFTHATPTLFNAGTAYPQMSSCFLMQMQEDSIDGIFNTLKQCALISKHAGGIGLSVHDVRAKGSEIKGTNGVSNGLIPMLRVFDSTARYVDQGGGKRNGSFAIYLEPWHADIEEFLEMKRNHGKEETKARDLFYALWVCDLFMLRVEEDSYWTLLCPKKCPGLSECFGEAFVLMYTAYESLGVGKRISARDLWNKIMISQIESGVPYMLYKDACNAKSNHQHLGTIKSSNLCCEVVQFTSKEEIAVCNLGSLNLAKFVLDGEVDLKRLHEVTRVLVRNLDRVIDFNFYPLPEAKVSNQKHRPIGVGVQGLADLFALLKVPFESLRAKELNQSIFDCIYYAACLESCMLAQKFGPYESFQGSPMSRGKFQFDLWNTQPKDPEKYEILRHLILKNGMRNSLLTAPMPTASTSQILGSTECFEPFNSNLYSRRVLAGDFMVINKHLVKQLEEQGLWDAEMREEIISQRGSVQAISRIPFKIRELFKTVWEMKQKTLLEMSADRGIYIDQSQSFNCHMQDVSVEKLSAYHMYGWKLGLKTGLYYLRTKPKENPTAFTATPKRAKECSEVCNSCSS
jgi:ribonucleoside-diphosphate reductase alpha subunit